MAKQLKLGPAVLMDRKNQRDPNLQTGRVYVDIPSATTGSLGFAWTARRGRVYLTPVEVTAGKLPSSATTARAVGKAVKLIDQAAGTATTAKTLHKYSPVLGIVLGSAGAFFLGSTFGKPAGWAAFAGAVGVGGAMWARQLLSHNTSGLGTIVPEYGTSGLGSIVMEPNSAQGYNAYSGGASVDIRGLGASGSGLAGGLGAGMDVSAFGPSSF